MGIPRLKFWPLQNGNSKNCIKKWEFPIFYVKNSTKLGIPIFCTQNDWKFWEFPCLLYPCNLKKCLIFRDFQMKNMVKIFGIPMSSLAGVHLISGIAHFTLQISVLRVGSACRWQHMTVYKCPPSCLALFLSCLWLHDYINVLTICQVIFNSIHRNTPYYLVWPSDQYKKEMIIFDDLKIEWNMNKRTIASPCMYFCHNCSWLVGLKITYNFVNRYIATHWFEPGVGPDFLLPMY